MGRIKDDERRLRAAMADKPGSPAIAMAKRLGINDSRSAYLRRKIGRSDRWGKALAAATAMERQLTADLQSIREPATETPEETDTDGDLPRQDRPRLDDRTGRPDDSESSD